MNVTFDAISRLRQFPRENDGRFGISKVSLDSEGLITAVLWQALDAAANAEARHESVVPVRAVIAAIRNGRHVVALFPTMPADLPERRFVVVEQGTRGATVALDGSPTPGRDVSDLYMLFLEGPGQRAARWPASGHSVREQESASPVSSQISP